MLIDLMVVRTNYANCIVQMYPPDASTSYKGDVIWATDTKQITVTVVQDLSSTTMYKLTYICGGI